MIACKIGSIAFVLAAIGTPAPAATEGENMMFAATIVIGAAYPVAGSIVVNSERQSSMKSYDRDFRDVVFEKAADCVYSVRIEFGGTETAGFEVVDFKKLSGDFHYYGRDLYFAGETKSACFRDRQGRSGCTSGLYLSAVTDGDRVVHDFSYLMRHGCGGGDPGPR